MLAAVPGFQILKIQTIFLNKNHVELCFVSSLSFDRAPCALSLRLFFLSAY